MVLLDLLLLLSTSFPVNRQLVGWIRDGGICKRNYGPDGSCIHYSNCADKYGGLTEGHPEFCYFSENNVILCCVENDKMEVNISSEETIPWQNSDYEKPPKEDEKEYSPNTVSQPPDYPIYSEITPHPKKKPPQLESQQPLSMLKPTTSSPKDGYSVIQKSPQPPPKQPDIVTPSTPGTKKGLPPCFGIAFGTATHGHKRTLNGPTIQNRFGLQCSKYLTTSTHLPHTTTNKKLSDIFGDQDVKPLEFPHMAILGYGNESYTKWHCGGSLISEKFVLTAAHCIDELLYGKVAFVSLGVHALRNFGSSIQKFKVNNTYTHPDYNPDTKYHDIALIELDNVASISQTGVKPARLHDSMEPAPKILIATGWGASETDEYSHILHKVDLDYISYNDCIRVYRTRGQFLKHGIVDNWQFCAERGDTGRNICGGDAGAPLQIKSPNDTSYIIVGVTSFANRCGHVPGFYTRVSNYVPWIEKFLRQ